MKKTIYLTILSIVTVFCIIFGTIYHLTGWFDSGNTFNLFRNNSSSKLDYSRVTYSEDLDSFDSIEIDTSAMDITIEIGDAYHLTYDCVAFLVPDVNVKNSTFKLIQPEIPHFGGSDNHCGMTLTIPADVALENADIVADIGNVTITDIHSGYITLQADIGDITIDSCDFNHSDIEADIGNLKINSCDLGETEIDADTGNISIASCDFTNIEVSNDMGNISLSTDMDLSGYSMDISTEMGNLTMNGKKIKRRFSQSAADSAGGCRLIIENDAGNIDVSYN